MMDKYVICVHSKQNGKKNKNNQETYFNTIPSRATCVDLCDVFWISGISKLILIAPALRKFHLTNLLLHYFARCSISSNRYTCIWMLQVEWNSFSRKIWINTFYFIGIGTKSHDSHSSSSPFACFRFCAQCARCIHNNYNKIINAIGAFVFIAHRHFTLICGTINSISRNRLFTLSSSFSLPLPLPMCSAI